MQFYIQKKKKGKEVESANGEFIGPPPPADERAPLLQDGENGERAVPRRHRPADEGPTVGPPGTRGIGHADNSAQNEIQGRTRG